MGGEYTARTYEGKLSKDEVRNRVSSDTEEMSYESGHGYSGTWVEKGGGVDFCGQTFASEDEADTWLCDNNDKWSSVGACYFDNKAGTKAQQTKLGKLNTKLSDLTSSHTILVKAVGSICDTEVETIKKDALKKMKSIKSKTKGCKHCGARHIVANLTSTDCSCGKTLMSDTEVKRVKNAIAKAEKKLKDGKTKARAKVSKSYEKLQVETKNLREFKTEIGVKQGWLVGGWCSC